MKNSGGTTASAISVNCQLTQNITTIMPTSVTTSTRIPSSPETMKRLDGVDVDGDAADEVAGRLLIVVGEREPLHVGVDEAAQIVRHPLADVGGEVFLA